MHDVHGRDGDNETSNYQELANLVTALEQAVEEGYLANSEVWVFNLI